MIEDWMIGCGGTVQIVKSTTQGAMGGARTRKSVIALLQPIKVGKLLRPMLNHPAVMR